MTYAARHGRDEKSPEAHAHDDELVEAAQHWIDDDPDHETRVELGDVLALAKQGDEAAHADLTGRARFLTARLAR